MMRNSRSSSSRTSLQPQNHSWIMKLLLCPLSEDVRFQASRLLCTICHKQYDRICVILDVLVSMLQSQSSSSTDDTQTHTQANVTGQQLQVQQAQTPSSSRLFVCCMCLCVCCTCVCVCVCVCVYVCVLSAIEQNQSTF